MNMTDFFEQWASRNQANAKLLAQEVLITEVTEAIWRTMEEVGITKAELAKKMEVTKGHVSQLLNGSRNMTLRTLADICFALDRKPSINLEAKKTVGRWESDRQVVFPIKNTGLRYIANGNVMTPSNGWKSAA
jgi:transcriptional regulator with XRE-family HTH domain